MKAYPRGGGIHGVTEISKKRRAYVWGPIHGGGGGAYRRRNRV